MDFVAPIFLTWHCCMEGPKLDAVTLYARYSAVARTKRWYRGSVWSLRGGIWREQERREKKKRVNGESYCKQQVPLAHLVGNINFIGLQKLVYLMAERLKHLPDPRGNAGVGVQKTLQTYFSIFISCAPSLAKPPFWLSLTLSTLKPVRADASM